jgi:hypothetical protein
VSDENPSEAGAAATKDPLAGMPAWFKRFAGWVAAIGFVLGQAVTVFTHFEEIRSYLVQKLGFSGFNQFHLVVALFIVGCAEAAYIAASVLVFVVYVRPLHRRYVPPFVLIAILGMPIVGFIALSAIPPADQTTLILGKQSELVSAVLGQIDPNSGGMRFSMKQQSDAPQPWSTAQGLDAVLADEKGIEKLDAERLTAVLNYLESHRVDAGWGYEEGSEPAVTEVTAWVAYAESATLRTHSAATMLNSGDLGSLSGRLKRDLDELVNRQHVDGGWGPREKSDDPAAERTYSALTSLQALESALKVNSLSSHDRARYSDSIRKGLNWLLRSKQTGSSGYIGWWPNPNLPSQTGQCLGLTAQSIEILAMGDINSGLVTDATELDKTISDFLRQTTSAEPAGDSVNSKNIEDNCVLGDTDTYVPPQPLFRMEPSTYLWYPWSLMAAENLKDDRRLSMADQARRRHLEDILVRRIPDAVQFAKMHSALYPSAETALGLASYSESRQGKHR